MTSSAPLSNAEQIMSKFGELQVALQTAAPGYESLLHQIHVALSKDEGLTYMLKPEEVGLLVAGLAKKKNIVIAENTAKGKTSGGKKLKDLEVGLDL